MKKEIFQKWFLRGLVFAFLFFLVASFFYVLGERYPAFAWLKGFHREDIKGWFHHHLIMSLIVGFTVSLALTVMEARGKKHT